MHVAINGGVGQWLRAGLGCQPSRYALIMCKPNAKDLLQVADWCAGGKLRAVVDGTFPFTAEGCAAAYDRVKSRRAKGKVVIVME